MVRVPHGEWASYMPACGTFFGYVNQQYRWFCIDGGIRQRRNSVKVVTFTWLAPSIGQV